MNIQALNKPELNALNGGQYWKKDPLNVNRAMYDIENAHRENQINISAIKIQFEKLVGRVKNWWT